MVYNIQWVHYLRKRINMQRQSAMDTISNSGQEEAIVNYIVCSLVLLSICTHWYVIHENASLTSPSANLNMRICTSLSLISLWY